MFLNKGNLTILFVLFLFTGVNSAAQDKKELQVIEQSKLLHRTVFGTKDSLALESLFAKTATYGHSGGKVEARNDAIRNIIHNQSNYTDTSLKRYDVIMADDVAIVRYSFKETETKKDGQSGQLNLSIMLVWVEEKGKWKLMGRQAVKIQ